MYWSYTPYSLVPLVAAVSTGALAAYAWGRGTRTGRLFALFALAGCIWALSYSFEILGGDLPTKLLWAKLAYAGTEPSRWHGWLSLYNIPAAKNISIPVSWRWHRSSRSQH